MEKKKIPTIHQTDLFHFFNDPDDHWDLATQFALAYTNDIELKGILIDHPREIDFGDPAIASISQLNVITGKSVPFAVGYKNKLSSNEDIFDIAKMTPLNSGINMLLKNLEEADEPITIHIVGSARDVAAAITLKPDLFKNKCKAIYLNAGYALGEKLEWNVEIDPFSYLRIFDAPFPLYWMPCFNEEVNVVEKHGTFWQFNQSEILPYLSNQLKNYFTYALTRSTDNRWLNYLEGRVNENQVNQLGKQLRSMWCTAGFLHSIGKTVNSLGQIVDITSSNNDAIFGFEQIDVKCHKNGKIDWNYSKSSQKFIFKVYNIEKYQSAMTIALKNILSKLP